jgi:hypothetical protein
MVDINLDTQCRDPVPNGHPRRISNMKRRRDIVPTRTPGSSDPPKSINSLRNEQSRNETNDFARDVPEVNLISRKDSDE